MTAPQPWPPARLCPATSNLPTRMLPASWRTLCAAMQRREAVGGRRGWKGGLEFYGVSAAMFPCATCAGRTLPPGLELITQEEATEMARTTKRGTCELCGASANVGMNHGAKVCPQCTYVQSALNKRIESVAAAARSMGKTEELLGHLIPAGGGIAVKMTADFLQEISGIVGYEGESPAELVEAVRRRVLTCASCDSEEVLHEIREIVGYTPEQGDKGLADAVRALEDAGSVDCAECEAANALIEIAELVGKQGAGPGQVAEAVRALLNEHWPPSESDEQTVTVAHRRMAVIKTLDRLYNAAEDRANLLQDDLARRDAIIARLRDQVAATDESLAEQELWKPEPAPTGSASTWADESLLADFGRRVLRGELAVQFLGVRP